MSLRLADYSRTLTGMEAYCIRAFAEALEIIPFTLAENAGLNPIATVTDLRNRHAQGEKTAGINVRKVCSCCMMMMQGMTIKKCSACPWGKLRLRSTCPEFILTCPDFFLLCAISPLL